MTRRRLLESAAVLTLGGVVLGRLPFLDGLIGAAEAQTSTPAPTPAQPATPPAPSQGTTAELMQPGPLGDMVMGQADAPVTIIEYASMTCSHCADFHTQTYPTLKSKYIETGKVRYILREFPLDPLAAGAFMLGRCAGNEKYFAVVETLFKEQKTWAFAQNPVPPLFAIAKRFGFNEQSFEKCLSDQKALDGIEETRRRAAEKFTVNSTPTFFVNGKIFRGAISLVELEREMAPYLKAS